MDAPRSEDPGEGTERKDRQSDRDVAGGQGWSSDAAHDDGAAREQREVAPIPGEIGTLGGEAGIA
jgi:hypothetical protein